MVNKQLYFIIGTRAELIKIAPVMRELSIRNIAYGFIYTNQHTETIDELLCDFDLKQPDISLFASTAFETRSMRLFLKWFIKMLYLLVFRAKTILPTKSLVIVHGDTVSAVWGAILAKVRGCVLVHIEAGLRSYNLLAPFPEEVDRMIVDLLSDYAFCPNELAVNNLKKRRCAKINTYGNTLYDGIGFVVSNKPQLGVNVHQGKYVVINIHRYELIRSKRKLVDVIEKIRWVTGMYRVVFVMHPVTETYLTKYTLLSDLKSIPNLDVVPKMPFVSFVNLLKGCEFVITDGGSNQQELSYLGIPTLILRNETESIEGLGVNAVLGRSTATFSDFIENYQRYRVSTKVEKSSPSEIVANTIDSILNGRTSEIPKK